MVNLVNPKYDIYFRISTSGKRGKCQLLHKFSPVIGLFLHGKFLRLAWLKPSDKYRNDEFENVIGQNSLL